LVTHKTYFVSEITTLAKQKAKAIATSKSDVIREILKARQSASVKEIRAELDERGVKASDALINKIKYGRNGNGAKKSRGRKAGSSASKADAIRNMLGEMGNEARSRDIIAALAKRGMAVSSAQVSTLRKTLHSSRSSTTSGSMHSVSLDHLLAAKNLAERLGGIDAARQALASLARLLET
jgi:arginine repressor